jgi:hypothetical protein
MKANFCVQELDSDAEPLSVVLEGMGMNITLRLS